MTAKEYLSQGRYLDQRINAKIDQVSSLHSLATNATKTLSDMPGRRTKNTHSMEDIIVKILTLENEINADIDRLVDLRREIQSVISRVENVEHRTLLERRYLNKEPWDVIADKMGCGIDNIYKMHGKALDEVKVP